ncbi:hypothetical protein NCAS_0C05480 [Naumovozyma castellii]|uniref:Uncharacterized protein n=1 Tax=Naumovozyma castellii TaxID=27288 RepID=G0VDH6_NAUCA|nr:hypothetical protein NCAS_0C05480 [Naumovozyma castellii CBS 4309]CCC69538.1 hypothetical protein NCAS_0C05480 [Naumovozyma castellii CBS 4309]
MILQESLTDAEDNLEAVLKYVETQQRLVRGMLFSLGDPHGISSISDLFIRNSVLLNEWKNMSSSPRKSRTLLVQKDIFQRAANEVYSKYIPNLKRVLLQLIKLSTIIAKFPDTIQSLKNKEKNIISIIPETSLLIDMSNMLDLQKLNHEQFLFFIEKYESSLFGTSNQIFILTEPHFENVCHITRVCKKKAQYFSLKLKSITESTLALIGVLGETEIKPSDLNFLRTYHSFKVIDNSTLDKALEMFERIQNLYYHRCEQRGVLLKKCVALWNKLNTTEDHISNFLKTNSRLTSKDLDAISTEFQRLTQIDIKCTTILLREKMEEIQILWSRLDIKHSYRKQFLKSIENSKDVNSTLDLYNSELKALRRKITTFDPIMNCVKELQILNKEAVHVEESSKHSERLTSRNYYKILKKEENLRNKIKKRAPKIIRELGNNLRRTEINSGETVTFAGQRIMDIVHHLDLPFDENPNHSSKVLLHTPRRSTKCICNDTNNTVEVSQNSNSIIGRSLLKLMSPVNTALLSPFKINKFSLTSRNPKPFGEKSEGQQAFSLSSPIKQKPKIPTDIPKSFIKPLIIRPINSNIGDANTLISPRTPFKFNNEFNLHSPYREPENSKYFFTKSPEGKVKLEIFWEDLHDGNEDFCDSTDVSIVSETCVN